MKTVNEKSMTITVNGDPVELENNLSVAKLLEQLRIGSEHTRGIAVAVNEEIVRRTDWNTKCVVDSDTVEIVTAQQGG